VRHTGETLPAAAAALLLAACAGGGAPASPAAGSAAGSPSGSRAAPARQAGLDDVAERYVKLVLATGTHDDGYVDAYYGPPAWRTEVERAPPDLQAIAAEAADILAHLAAHPPAGDELAGLRHRFLRRQTEAVAARVRLLGGERMSFDEESVALYDAVAPHLSEGHFAALVEEVGTLLPGEGEVSARLEAFRAGFAIPPDRLDRVFRAAIDECRSRTAARLELPPGETFALEYVRDRPWSGYNWYQGSASSLIQVNVDLPVQIDRAVDLACHEGYPGHHVYNALLERRLVVERGMVELSVYPLYSPQSLIAEGSANYGVELAFPPAEKLAFERDRLYPLAGLAPLTAERYHRVLELVRKLSYAGNEAARRYLDGEIDRAAAERWLERYALYSPERAAQRVRFFDTYRSYVINYNLGQDMVKAYVERRGGPGEAQRWRVFEELLSTPRLPSDLVAGAE
jgi:hypothetical protein